MAVDFFLKLDGIKGESTDSKATTAENVAAASEDFADIVEGADDLFFVQTDFAPLKSEPVREATFIAEPILPEAGDFDLG
ncbi:MAG: hypothetical protein AAF568_03885 [Pseudomonadota bacterium]